jgi:NTP pyrophosphatase (non-canonical NTP hydrolase)
MNKRFVDRIKWMNETFEIASNDRPTDLGIDRVAQFRSILREEVRELDEIIEANGENTEHRLVSLADFLGDIIVYVTSEARRWGIPIEQVLDCIMDSQESKLVDNKPLKDERDKFVKGPNYRRPEPMIAQVLRQ